TGAAPTGAAPTAAAPASSAPRRDFTHADLVAWKTVRNAQLSNDGRWFAYQLAPNEGDGEVVLRGVADGKEVHIPIGEPPAAAPVAPGGAASSATVAFSGDGEWLAVTAYPTQAAARRLRREHKPAQTAVVIVHTRDGQQRRFERVRHFAFAGPRPAYVVMHGYPADAPAGGAGTAGAGPTLPTGLPGGTPAPVVAARVEPADLLVHRLGTETVLTVGSVGEFAPDSSGAWLAYTIEGRDPQGNGVQLHDLRTGLVRVLDSQRALYRRLAWNDSLAQLAVLRGVVDTVAHDTAYAVLGFRDFGARADGPRVTTVALAGRANAPRGMQISPDRTPRWTEAGDGLLFGLREHRPATPRDSAPDDDRPNLMIWHWKEPRLQSQQIVQEQADRTFSYLAAYWTGADRVVALADTAVRQVTMLPHDRWAIGVDVRADERRGYLEGLPRVDYTVVDPHTGERRTALRALRQGPTLPSPDGRRLLFFADGDFHVLDLATAERRNLTAGAPVPFWDAEDDHNVEKPATTPVGWSTDGNAVLLSDNWDVWRVPAAGGAPVNLTRTGRQEKIRYQRRIVVDPRLPGIDPRQPLYVATYGERTKKGGLARVDVVRGGATSVIFDDAAFAPRRARDADVWVTTRSTFTEAPDWWRLQDGRLTDRLTAVGAQLAAFRWSAGTRLVDYVCANGDSLQATVFLPAGYAPGTRYPTVVTFYEKMSQNRHVFTQPSEVNGVMVHPGMFASRGYAIVMPDITYRVNDPGVNAVGCMVPAVRAAVASGVVDSARVGIQGHSWSGYQTAFIITQTPIFRAAVAGAPLTDMVSMYSSVYWNSGMANQAIFQSSQGRFRGNFLSNWDAYVRNSPNRFADRIVTPLLMLHNDRDGAVDFNQGITFYNTLKQLGKPVILLEYPGENHGLAQRANQKDYQQRLAEWFDVQLRGAPAPDWIARGVPRLEMEDYLRSRRQVASAPAVRAAPTVAPQAPGVPTPGVPAP
ncbi:MAG TPA: prolyl oligopeptidase family serine peptidase, partial [Gemmatirosa sp.]